MSRFLGVAAATVAALATLSAPQAAHAAQINPLSCDVNIVYSLNNAVRLTYARTFVIGLDSPYQEDISTAIRFGFFDAVLTDNGGTPHVTINFDSDVSVFNGIAFTAEMDVKNDNKGETTTGVNRFFSSAPGAAGNHTTTYTLTCIRAR